MYGRHSIISVFFIGEIRQSRAEPVRKRQEGVETRYSNLSENMAKYPRAHDTRRMGDDIVRYSSESWRVKDKEP